MACTISPDDIKRVKGLGYLHNKGTDCFSARVLTGNGKVTAAQLSVIAEAAEKFGSGEVAFTSRMTVEMPGIHLNDIEAFQEFIGKAGLEVGGTGPKVRPIVSCKGTTCHFGLIDTFGLAEKIHERFYKGYHDVVLPHKFKIAVGGCPNNCVKPDLNDLGIIGQRPQKVDEALCRGCAKCGVAESCPMKAASVVDGKLVIDRAVCNNCGRCEGKCYFGASGRECEGFRVYVGGRWGKQGVRGTALSRVFTSEEEVLNVVEKAILLFREKGNAGERFGVMIDRLGFENVEAELLSDDILARKEEILK